MATLLVRSFRLSGVGSNGTARQAGGIVTISAKGYLFGSFAVKDREVSALSVRREGAGGAEVIFRYGNVVLMCMPGSGVL